MRRQILAGAMMTALAAGATTGAMAFDHKGHGGTHVRGFHAGGAHSFRAARNSRLAGVNGSESRRQSDWSHGDFIDLGPLGITAACGSYSHKHAYCGPGCSVSAWSY
jgi:hypothetical protein